MKQKILVAGGTGYIGSHTTVELQNAGYEVVIIDDLSNSNIEVLDGIERITGIRPEFIKLDLKDKEGTREAESSSGNQRDYPVCRQQSSRRIRTAAVEILPQQRSDTGEPVGTDAGIQYRRHCILFFLYRLWAA